MSTKGETIRLVGNCGTELDLPVRQRTGFDRPAGYTARSLGLGPAPAPEVDGAARRVGIGLLGTLACVVWLWSLAPPPL